MYAWKKMALPKSLDLIEDLHHPNKEATIKSLKVLYYRKGVKLATCEPKILRNKKKMLCEALNVNSQLGKFYQVLYELSLCVVKDKSRKRNSEDTWVKVTKTTLQG